MAEQKAAPLQLSAAIEGYDPVAFAYLLYGLCSILCDHAAAVSFGDACDTGSAWCDHLFGRIQTVPFG